jgi:hypothetical protein
MLRANRPNGVWVLFVAALLLPAATATTTMRWGRDGHHMAGLVAASRLPDDMPAFFRDAGDQLAWLNYDPDRWRNDGMIESNEAFQYDHFIDLEKVPDAALNARNRFVYLDLMKSSGINRPETMGLLPFRIVELTQRLTNGFRQWREETDPRTRAWMEQRIINDAGILGHYVADGANPHHTTIHFNGWDANSVNSQGYTTNRTFHRRFESDFVSARVRVDDVMQRASSPARELGNVRADVIAYLRRGNGLVRRLYDLEKKEMFSSTTVSTEHRDFATDRIAEGAMMLRSIWYTAWRNSADR